MSEETISKEDLFKERIEQSKRIEELVLEIERLHSNIKEVREYIKDIQNTMWHDDKEVLKTILEILDKEKQ